MMLFNLSVTRSKITLKTLPNILLLESKYLMYLTKSPTPWDKLSFSNPDWANGLPVPLGTASLLAIAKFPQNSKLTLKLQYKTLEETTAT